ncbi:MAG: hypothetical protein DWQ31_07905 [Planctomycetota bacterium]|nr:MAG: hypothetical protein DWQ31_07905 [Planctomycetota bacterium]REJ96116.1 MAG: hypothetical protein DWQ35_05255 [Planctomycetota bacterium]REK21888.1 MAG: hypothetical protein DWQ42_18585 [Planctomycetota bacterium]
MGNSRHAALWVAFFFAPLLAPPIEPGDRHSRPAVTIVPDRTSRGCQKATCCEAFSHQRP